jgi:exopolysaccharide production protein ExoY
MNLLDSSRHVGEETLEKQPARNLRQQSALEKLGLGTPRILRFRTSYSASPDYAGEVFSGPISRHSQGGALFDDSRTESAKPLGGTWKRCFDCSVAVGGLIVMSPVMLIIALLILVTMGRPVFFIQQRMGYGKSPFRCFKFRTMVPDAQETLARYLAANSEAAQAWRETQKLKHDPRITWLGHVLRKSSLDELPQLFNILRGEMSCVGPRPVLAAELQRYGAYAEDYARAKPGLTGIWQVSGRSNTTYAHRVNCDRYYVRRWSLSMDLIIILRTVPAVMRFRDTA